jgi:hypothetical protein
MFCADEIKTMKPAIWRVSWFLARQPDIRHDKSNASKLGRVNTTNKFLQC